MVFCRVSLTAVGGGVVQVRSTGGRAAWLSLEGYSLWGCIATFGVFIVQMRPWFTTWFKRSRFGGSPGICIKFLFSSACEFVFQVLYGCVVAFNFLCKDFLLVGIC